MPPPPVAEIRAQLQKIRTEEEKHKPVFMQHEKALEAEMRDKSLANRLPALITCQNIIQPQTYHGVALDHTSDEDYFPSEVEDVLLSKRKKKKKIRAQLTILDGAERCEGCMEQNIPCRVNMDRINKVRKARAEGRVFRRTPAGVRCEGCLAAKIACHLPCKDDSKAKEAVKDYEGPGQKKRRVMASAEPVENMPTWAPRLEGLSKALNIELTRSLNAHVRRSVADERIANALDKLADRFMQDV